MYYECSVAARVRDLNAGAHVDSVEAARILDEARMLFLGAPGIAGVLAPAPTTITMLMAGLRVDYRREMALMIPPEPFRVSLAVARVGTSSVTMQLRMWGPGRDQAEAADVHAEQVIVLIDRVAGAPWVISEPVREAFSAYQEPPFSLRIGS